MGTSQVYKLTRSLGTNTKDGMKHLSEFLYSKSSNIRLPQKIVALYFGWFLIVYMSILTYKTNFHFEVIFKVLILKASA